MNEGSQLWINQAHGNAILDCTKRLELIAQNEGYLLDVMSLVTFITDSFVSAEQRNAVLYLLFQQITCTSTRSFVLRRIAENHPQAQAMLALGTISELQEERNAKNRVEKVLDVVIFVLDYVEVLSCQHSLLKEDVEWLWNGLNSIYISVVKETIKYLVFRESAFFSSPLLKKLETDITALQALVSQIPEVVVVSFPEANKFEAQSSPQDSPSDTES